MDWLLYELPNLRELTEEIMPKAGESVIPFHSKTKTMVRSRVEAVAIKRALLTQTLDAAEKATKRLPLKYKQVYKLRYRSGLTIWQIAARLKICKNTVHSRVGIIRDLVAAYLHLIPGSEINALTREYGRWVENNK